MEVKDKKELIDYMGGKPYWKHISLGGYPAMSFIDQDIEEEEFTWFPSRFTAACSWDVSLMEILGECTAAEVKKGGGDLFFLTFDMPRYYRWGMYGGTFGEDPHLASTLAAGFVRGAKKVPVLTGVQGFLQASREETEMGKDVLIDQRSFYERHVKSLERVVKTNPDVMMGSLGKVNGVAFEKDPKIDKLLRKKWNYQGVVMAPPKYLTDPLEAMAKGINLDPSYSPVYNEKRMESTLLPKTLEDLAKPVKELFEKNQVNRRKSPSCDYNVHEEVARKIASESAVLLKNNGKLPLSKTGTVALIGSMAQDLGYFQPVDLKPTRMPSFLQVFREKNISFLFQDPDSEGDLHPFKAHLAKEAASLCDATVVFVTTQRETKKDRESLELLPIHQEMIREMTLTGGKIILVVFSYGPFALENVENVEGIIYAGAPGQTGAYALTDLLFGDKVPCGKLASTFPRSLEDTPAGAYYQKEESISLVKEGLFSGYFFYQETGTPVYYPFGFGLSYCNFIYRDLKVSLLEDRIHLSFTLTNESLKGGKEIYQIYFGLDTSVILREKKRLVGFGKVFLGPKEKKEIQVEIPLSELDYYDLLTDDFEREGGEYTFYVGGSSEDLPLSEKIPVVATTNVLPTILTHPYRKVSTNMSHEDFELLLRRSIVRVKGSRRIQDHSTIEDIRKIKRGEKRLPKLLEALGISDIKGKEDIPLSALIAYESGRCSYRVKSILHYINKERVSGLYYKIKSLLEKK